MAEVWGLPYADQIDKGHISFFKALLHLPSNSPNHFIRLESGQVHITNKIFKRTLNWWLSLLNMPENVLPKLCCTRRLELQDQFSLPFNRATWLRNYLIEIGAEEV